MEFDDASLIEILCSIPVRKPQTNGVVLQDMADPMR